MDYFVGDIHGCFTRLYEQLDTFFDYENDTLYCTGDLVDRGPDNLMVIDFLNRPWVKSVMGNHEDMIIQGYQNPDMKWLSQMNGGQWFWDLPAEMQDGIVFLFKEKLPISRTVYINDLKIGIIHAEPPQDWNDPHEPEHSMWSRTKIQYGDTSVIKNVDMVFVGHTPVRKPTVLGNVHYIDNGAWNVNRTLVRKHIEQGIPHEYLYTPFEFHKI